MRERPTLGPPPNGFSRYGDPGRGYGTRATALMARSLLCWCLGLGLTSTGSAGDHVPIKTILEHPSTYGATVVTVEGRARAVSTLPAHRGTRNCGGGTVYDSQTFTLHDKSGSIGVGTTGACRPNVMKPVVENELVRIRGIVVVTDQNNPKSIPVIFAQAIERERS
ncbi:hypothetical protein YTPLAS18_00930 [Nitrospira sp.]|nr:hypothetical protein YTPLAS18_00930 [Nitrospira sp.]